MLLNVSGESGEAHIAASNHSFYAARRLTRDAIAAAGKRLAEQNVDGFRVEQLTDIKLPLRGGADWKPDEIYESLVDGIEIALRLTLQESTDLSGNPRFNEVNWDDVAIEMNLGSLYRHTEDLWDDCLWNGYQLVDKGRRKLFRSRDSNVKRGFVAGLSRRQSLTLSFTIVATKHFRDLHARGLFREHRVVRAIERKGKQQIIRLSKPGELTDAIEHLMVMRGYASEPYYSELLEEPLAFLDGLTLSNVIEAWTLISSTALLLVESVEKKFEAHVDVYRAPHTWLPEYVPTLQIDALAAAIASTFGIKLAEGRRLVDFFTYRGSENQELWSQPLVPVGINTVAPVFAAIVSPNLRRLVDVWMRQVEIDLARRGPAFEAHIRATVARSIRESKILAGHSASIEEDYTFKPTAQPSHQLDLVFSIGNTVFVAEVKCILEPTDTKSVAMHRETVEHAAEQAICRAESLTRNREEFSRSVKAFGINLTREFNVVPLVVVSTCTHVGVPSKGVPVVDELILHKFFDGDIEEVAVQGTDFDVRPRMKTVFYTDASEAEGTSAKYFESPPQLARFLNGTHRRILPLHPVDKQDWAGLVEYLDCKPTNPSPSVDAST